MAPRPQFRAKISVAVLLLAAPACSMSMGAGNDPKRVWTVKPAAKPAGGAPVPAVPARKDEAAQKALAELQKSRAPPPPPAPRGPVLTPETARPSIVQGFLYKFHSFAHTAWCRAVVAFENVAFADAP